MTVTITKADMAVVVEEKYSKAKDSSDIPCNTVNSATVVRELVALIIDSLREFKIVSFKCYGKLIPSFQKGGRPVRNPKTGESKPMFDCCTVRRSNNSIKAHQTKGRVNTSDLVTMLSERLDRLAIPTMDSGVYADVAVKTFLEFLSDTTTGEARIELRGLGTFHAKYRDEHTARNPKSGEKVLVPPKWVYSFKVSKQLRQQMMENLNEKGGENWLKDA